MSKVTVVGNGFIQIDGSDELINLRGYKGFSKGSLAYDTPPAEDGKVYTYLILATPLNPSEQDVEDGVDGSFGLLEYEEEEPRNEDLKKIAEALKSID